MKKLILTVVVGLSATVVFAKVSPEQLAINQMRAFGGKIQDRRAAKGIVTIVNTQKQVMDSIIREGVDKFTESVFVDTKFESGTFDIGAPLVKGDATLFIVDDNKLPMSLVALEAKWAMVNVAKLKADKEVFFYARVKKEVYRMMCYLLGVGNSLHPNCITGSITKAEDLDEISELRMPVDFSKRFESYLFGLGIVPYKLVPYRRACQEGWAPAPTNEFQKAIWDKVHETPSNPIQIKFDPKTDKE